MQGAGGPGWEGKRSSYAIGQGGVAAEEGQEQELEQEPKAKLTCPLENTKPGRWQWVWTAPGNKRSQRSDQQGKVKLIGTGDKATEGTEGHSKV